jgi:hypothetical protein
MCFYAQFRRKYFNAISLNIKEITLLYRILL